MDVTGRLQTLQGRYTDVTRTLLPNIDQILTKYDQIVTKYYQNDQIHVEKIQERHFLTIKKTT